MHFSTALPALVVLLSSFVAADLHFAGVCVDKIGGAQVYNADATQKACNAYLHRNTGSKQWDQCPDCVMKNIGNLNVCHSGDWHIGGDELSYYCKQNGARGSLAS
ncbi:hypothetical protein DDE82_007395 [Stemphylium lycopersici]|uniref:Cyanovirin-N domain-containing protein n=1 Tax=Stemphylium lycopersici TaxID=183478 RepID=A0A364MZR7_STELY|nr:hypothetical protein TW65_07408 [Stemphylium lycopersici]RAR00314.1 hypothetical protein DDE82_007395 [Stemphylium lycopersici]RAR08029.1 hypothetical protein DDE83_006201 [Stemphylium lycopersici]